MTVCHSSTHVAAVHLGGKRGRVARLKSMDTFYLECRLKTGTQCCGFNMDIYI